MEIRVDYPIQKQSQLVLYDSTLVESFNQIMLNGCSLGSN